MVKIRVQGDTLQLPFLSKLLTNIEKAFGPNTAREQYRVEKKLILPTVVECEVPELEAEFEKGVVLGGKRNRVRDTIQQDPESL